jgi:iron-sulfur cluster repair protein YtfE (RIC family)
MNSPATNHEEFDRLLEEHEDLREQLERVHDAIKSMAPAPTEIKALLDEFEEALVIHFAHEEIDGFFDAVTVQAHSLAGEANRLCAEHNLLRNQAAELCRFAASGSASTPWWRELALRCHVFSQKLMHHESAENALLQIASHQQVAITHRNSDDEKS